MRFEDQNVSLHDMKSLGYNDWKSRQFVKRNEDRYKEHVAKNPTARLIDEALKSLVNNKAHSKPNNSREVAV
jgi:hypothetical protein